MEDVFGKAKGIREAKSCTEKRDAQLGSRLEEIQRRPRPKDLVHLWDLRK